MRNLLLALMLLLVPAVQAAPRAGGHRYGGVHRYGVVRVHRHRWGAWVQVEGTDMGTHGCRWARGSVESMVLVKDRAQEHMGCAGLWGSWVEGMWCGALWGHQARLGRAAPTPHCPPPLTVPHSGAQMTPLLLARPEAPTAPRLDPGPDPLSPEPPALP